MPTRPERFLLRTARYFPPRYLTLYALTVAFIWFRVWGQKVVGIASPHVLPFANRSSQTLVIKSPGSRNCTLVFSSGFAIKQSARWIWFPLTSWREEMGGQALAHHTSSSAPRLPTPSHSQRFSHCSSTQHSQRRLENLEEGSRQFQSVINRWCQGYCEWKCCGFYEYSQFMTLWKYDIENLSI